MSQSARDVDNPHRKQALSLKNRYKTDPMYRSLQDKHCKEMAQKAGEVNRIRLKGKTLEELYGQEKAQEIRSKLSNNFKLGETKCSICGEVLTEDNTYLYQKKRHDKFCKKCYCKLSNDRAGKRLIKVYERIFSILGTSCSKCGFSNPRALQIDHIRGGGNVQRKRMGGSTFYTYLSKLPAEELRASYQVLCANCNWIKRYENGEGLKLGVPYRSAIFQAIENVQRRSL